MLTTTVGRLAALALAASCALAGGADAQPSKTGDAVRAVAGEQAVSGPLTSPPPILPAFASPTQIPPPPMITAPTVTAGPQPARRLSGASLYIYSFLDVRDAEFTPGVLGQLDRQLEVALDASGVTSKLLNFRDSAPGSDFAQETVRPIYGQYHTTEMIPVGQTVASNLAEERAFGAQYRLLIFPTAFETNGAWRFYKITWTLVDCASGQRLWTYLYNGRTLVLLYNGERADSRAKAIVETFMSQLKGGGFL